jgi:hypothetical protein
MKYKEAGDWSLTPFPNGIVKAVLHFFDDYDDNIGTFTTFNEIYHRNNIFGDNRLFD